MWEECKKKENLDWLPIVLSRSGISLIEVSSRPERRPQQ